MSAGINLFTLTENERNLGVDALAEILSRFSFPLNSDIEDYLKNPKRARNSSLMSSSVTYLALEKQTGDLLGYFTLMMKAYSVSVRNSTNGNLKGISVMGGRVRGENGIMRP